MFPVLYQRYGPIPSRSCNVEAFPIPYLGALERVAHVVGGWSSDTPRARASLSSLDLTHPRSEECVSLGVFSLKNSRLTYLTVLWHYILYIEDVKFPVRRGLGRCSTG